jgi:hypothetical protein
MNDHANNTYNSAFFIVPSYILDLPGLTLGFLKVYESIFQFWNHNKTCFLSEKSLCARTTLKRSQIYEALAYFERHGEVKRVRKGLKRYLVRPEKIIETDCTDVIQTSAVPDIGTTIDQTSATPDVDVRSTGRNTSATADYNTKKRTKEIKKTSTTSVSSSFIITEKLDNQYLAYKVDTDPRSDEVFLKHCKHHIENNSDPALHINQRRSGIKKILSKCFEAKEIFESRDYLDPEEQRIKKEEQEARMEAQSEAQEKLHWEKMERLKKEQETRQQSKPSQERRGSPTRLADMLKNFKNAN